VNATIHAAVVDKARVGPDDAPCWNRSRALYYVAMHNAPAPAVVPDDDATDATRDEERATISDIIRFALMQRICLSVRYNNMDMLLAPHMLWTKHGDLHVDAVTVERAGSAPKVLKIGTFKLAGLGKVALTSRTFVPQPEFVATDPKYAEAPIASVQR